MQLRTLAYLDSAGAHAAIAATNVLTRTEIKTAMGDFPPSGRIKRIGLYIDTILGGAANVSKLTLGHKDEDGRYIISALDTATPWQANAADATKATLWIDVTEGQYTIEDWMVADTTNYAGWFLGIQLDVGTADVYPVIVVES